MAVKRIITSKATRVKILSKENEKITDENSRITPTKGKKSKIKGLLDLNSFTSMHN